MNCRGYEERLFDCTTNVPGNARCGHTLDAGAICLQGDADVLCITTYMIQTDINDLQLLELAVYLFSTTYAI